MIKYVNHSKFNPFSPASREITHKLYNENIKPKVEEIQSILMAVIPFHEREGLLLRVAVSLFLSGTASVGCIYLTKKYTESILPISTPTLISVSFFSGAPFKIFSGIYNVLLKRTWNNRKCEIKTVIENSKDNKEGAAIYITAHQSADHNFALSDGVVKLEDVKALAQKFLVKDEIVTTSKQVSEAIENFVRGSSLPVKVVVIKGHGNGKRIYFGPDDYLNAENLKFIDALKKIDERAHIILLSCSTGKTRSEKGIFMADQLSLQLPGRTVTAPAFNSCACLRINPKYPQKIAVRSFKQLNGKAPLSCFTNSFLLENGIRNVKTTITFIEGEEDLILKKYEDKFNKDDIHVQKEGVVSNYECMDAEKIKLIW